MKIDFEQIKQAAFEDELEKIATSDIQKPFKSVGDATRRAGWNVANAGAGLQGKGALTRGVKDASFNAGRSMIAVGRGIEGLGQRAENASRSIVAKTRNFKEHAARAGETATGVQRTFKATGVNPASVGTAARYVGRRGW